MKHIISSVSEIVTVVVIIINICSCRQDLTMKNQEIIIGEWYPLDSITNGYFSIYSSLNEAQSYNMIGYQFGEDNLCVNKLGFFEYIDPNDGFIFSKPIRDISGDNFLLQNVIRFWGNSSVYKIENDSLKIYDPSVKIWSEQKMSFQTKDTMILSRYNDSIVERYARKTYTIDNTPLFDQIILYYPHTKFSDSKIFSIQRDGTFFSKKYFEQSWFVAETDKSVFEQIEVLFKKSDLMNMESLNSRTSVTNQLRINDVIMTIVCGNKMYTIDRVFQQIHFNNIEFYWAFFSALYTPETVNIMPKESVNEENTAPFVLKDYIRYKLVRNDSVEIRLHLTEHFYLTTLLYNAPLTEQTFIPMYKLFAGSDFKTTIETDGRFFKYDIEHYESKTVKKSITLDIGFNFIEENHLDK